MGNEPKPNQAPLAGLRVIEVGAFIAGPYCGQLLADFGADVIKVEPPGNGDPMRQWGVHKFKGQSLWWPVIGRNKRSITLDLRQLEGQALAKRLIATSDVLVENFRPGTLEEWNLDPEELRRQHPRLIIGRISGFGQTGPYREHAGFAAVCEAMAGLRLLTGYPDRPPTRVGLSLGDSLAGLFAAFGIMNALYARDHGANGGGQTVDAAITESVLAFLESVVSEYSITGKVRERTGPVLPGVAPSNLYPTADGSWVIIAANADGPFRRLAEAMGEPELSADPHFLTHEARGQRQEELDLLVTGWTKTKSRAEILELLIERQVPAGFAYDASDITKDEHYRERNAVVQVETDDFGSISMQGIVPKLSATPGDIRWTGPKLGQHNTEIYQGILGLTQDELARLQAMRVI
jgi:crotonobetainyl-CoA:carnitine CoA-transferase CaiB-like acyl-CoA transferase